MTEDFPCSARSSSYTHATANTPARLPGACFAHFPGSGSLPRIDWQVGPCITVFEACSAFTHVAACVLAKSPSDPLHRRLQPFRYLHDCSDCYRPERKRPGGFRTRWKSADFARRTSNSGVLFVGMAMGSGFAFTWLDAVWNGSLRLMHAYFVLQATSAMVQARGDADPMSRHDARD